MENDRDHEPGGGRREEESTSKPPEIPSTPTPGLAEGTEEDVAAALKKDEST